MILVSDANIFIDLDSINLLPLCEKIRHKIVITDIVYKELYTSQQKILDAIDVEKLVFNPDELIELYIEYQKLGIVGISPEDFSLILKAKNVNGSILTGDKQLRNFSKREKIDVYGIFFILDIFLKDELLSRDTWINKLKKLQMVNSRLPQKEFEKRLI